MYWVFGLALFVIGLILIPKIRPIKVKPIASLKDVASAPSTKLRPMSLMERWYSASHDSGVYLNFCVGVEIEGEIPSRDAFREAGVRLMAAYPQLSFHIVDNNHQSPCKGHVMTGPKDPQPIIEYIDRQDEDSWKRVIEKEQHRGFGSNPPLWRLTIVSSAQDRDRFDLVFCFYHGFVDGVSGHILADKFMILLDGGDVPTSDALPVPLENLLDISPTIGRIAEELFYDAFPKMNPRHKAYLGPPHQADVWGHHMGYVSFSSEEVTRLLMASRSQGSTINSAISASAHFALAKYLNRSDIECTFGCAVNLRSRTQPPRSPDEIGVYVCEPNFFYRISKSTSFWKFANQCRNDIQTNIESACQTIGILQFLPGSWIDFFQRRAARSPNGRSESLNLSNIGQLTFAKTRFQIRDVWFTNGKPKSGPLFNICAVTVNNRLTLSVGVPFVVSEADAQRFIALVKEAMMHACEKSDFTIEQFLS
eukprot:TRINITY_DN11120_c0_g1_i1.p1 TRINITY_DN11120_c0_g1~~TRINITY_DN11120_c0_g1_i1.p1  ORF type:complete len:479 (-),score=105.64 TRINITY_DN11120_c0_g1_i1:180-1616(-)